jgi:hypothetical protein
MQIADARPASELNCVELSVQRIDFCWLTRGVFEDRPFAFSLIRRRVCRVVNPADNVFVMLEKMGREPWIIPDFQE